MRRANEVAIQRFRVWSIALGLVQSLLVRGDRPWVQLVAIAGAALTWAAVRRLLSAGSERLAVAGWVAMAGDTICVSLIMGNLLGDANDPIQLLPLILVGEAAARWGRRGGFVGGVIGALLTSVWVVVVHRRNRIDLPASFVTFRLLFFVLLGTFVGSMVQQMRQQRRSAEAVFNGSRDLVATFGLDGRLQAVNPACLDILGYLPEEIIGQDRAFLLDARSMVEVPDLPDVPGYRRDGARAMEVCVTRKDGRPVWLEIDLIPDLDDGLVRVIGRDVSDRRRTVDELRRRVELDELTGALNRGALMQRLTDRLAGAKSPGLVFVDLDHFKTINDRHGHVLGDQALVEVVQRLTRAAGPHDEVARFAGDEFCVVIAHPDDVEVVVGRITEALALPYSIGGAVVEMTASIGMATAEIDDTGRDLLDRADQAMYRVKRAERRTGTDRRDPVAPDAAVAGERPVVTPIRPGTARP